MTSIRAWRMILAILVGTFSATLTLFIALALADLLFGQSDSLPILLDHSRGMTFLVNFVWCALLPSILAALGATILIPGLHSLKTRAGLAATMIAGVTGAIVSTLIWTNLTHNAQGPNPLMLVGFIVSSLLAPLVTIRMAKPQR